jgi:ubiquinone/menaquinone biosynthesis C-methylase UbiE
MQALKDDVRDFWDHASCGEELYLRGNDLAAYEQHAQTRYKLEPYILEFADFATTNGLRVLEIGVGLGADHQRFASAGADLYGIDLTDRAVQHTQRRLSAYGLASKLGVGDAENLNFPDRYFDVVYSWGVLHHTPDTRRAVREIWRVLKPGGVAKVMLYHKWSLVGLMLWVRYALLRLRPWLTLEAVYARHLESPGTKAYSKGEIRTLFADFSDVRIRIVLSHGDLLESAAGQRHRGPLLSLARLIWPRRLLRRWFGGLGLFALVEAKRPI